MNRALAATLASIVAMGSGVGCAWWKANGTQVVTDVGQLAACVIGDIYKGTADPTQIVKDCQGTALADVIAIIDSLLSDPHVTAERAQQLRSLRRVTAARMSQ